MAINTTSTSTETVSFSKYDSSTKATIVESIQHAETNPLLIDNMSDQLVVEFEGEKVIIQEPSCTFKDMIHFFDDVLETVSIPSSEFYRPEITAKRLYDNADLAYVLLVVNKIFTKEKYNLSTIKHIPAKELTRITRFLKLGNQQTRTVTDSDLTGLVL